MQKKRVAIMQNITPFQGIAMAAMTILIALMLSRPGVSFENLASYVGSGLVFEIAPTITFGFLITCAHYAIFEDPIILHNYANNLVGLMYAEWAFNGVFCSVALVIAWGFLRKFAGIGFISAVSLCYYTYWLSMQ
jgi:hypothetical protein